MINTEIDLTGELYTHNELNGEISTTNDLNGEINSNVELLGEVSTDIDLSGELSNNIELYGELGTGIELNGQVDVITSGTYNYEYLYNKPQINSVELIKNKSFEDLGINEITNTELNELFKDL